MGSYWSRVSPIDWCPLKGELGDDRHTGRTGCKDEGTDFKLRSTLETTANQQKPEKGMGQIPFLLTALRRN